jgi:hypothetical protein
MKRLPLLLAIFTALFATICFFQLRGRGIGFVPPPTDWELHPAWWHFDFLAAVGVYLVEMPALFLLTAEAWVADLLGIKDPGRLPEFCRTIVAWTAFVIPIAIESSLVFYITRGFVSYVSRHPKRRPAKEEVIL